MSEEISPAKLEQMFGPAHEMAHHGMCIEIPEERFLPSWEPQLKGQGWFIIRVQNARRKGVILVTHEDPALKEEKEQESASTVREEPHEETTSKGAIDEDLLIKLWKKKTKVAKIAEHFPGYTLAAIQNRLTAMQRKGLIKPRWRKKHKESKERKETEEHKEPEKKTLGQLVDEEPKALGEILGKIAIALVETVDCLECQALMHTLEVHESNGVLVIPPSLRTLYANALVEQSMRDLFKQKTRHFLEVCT